MRTPFRTGSVPNRLPAVLTRRRAIGVLGGSAGAALLAASCRGSKRSGTSPQKAAGSGKPKAGGQLNLVATTEPTTFDPIFKTASTATVLRRSHDGLLDFKSGPDVPYANAVLEGDLADRWESPDAQTYTFHLRPGINFANLPPLNGRSLTASDVKWTFDYLGRTGLFTGVAAQPATSMWDGLDKVEAPDPTTAVFHFSQPMAPFLNYTTTAYASIVGQEIYQQDGSFDKHDVGTGPWQLNQTDSKRGQVWIYKRNPGYFEAALPYIQEIHDLIITDSSTQIAALQTRQVDALAANADQVAQVKSTNPDIVVYEYLPPQDDHIYMNNQKRPLSDQRIRKAFALCIDRDAFIKTLSHGKGEWALAGSMPGLFTEEEAKKILQVDPSQAAQLVRAAGYANGVDMEFMYAGERWGPVLVAKLQLLQAQVKAAGINLTLKDVDEATESKRRLSGDFDLAYTPSGQFLAGDLDGPLYTIHYSKSDNNYSRVNDPVLDPILVKQRQEVDPNKRREIWRQAVQRINEVPDATALFYGQGYTLWQPYVKNYAPNIGYFGGGDDFRRAWLSK